MTRTLVYYKGNPEPQIDEDVEIVVSYPTHKDLGIETPDGRLRILSSLECENIHYILVEPPEYTKRAI